MKITIDINENTKDFLDLDTLLEGVVGEILYSVPNKNGIPAPRTSDFPLRIWGTDNDGNSYKIAVVTLEA